MFLKQQSSGDLVEVMDLVALANPFETRIDVQFQCGEDLADPVSLGKDELVFPSGEALPQCWCDSHYRDHELKARH